MIPFANLILSGALVGALACNAALAHGGEDHTHPASTPGAALPTQGLPSGGHASRESARRQADGSVFVPKPTQRLLVLRTTMTEQGSFHRSVELPGRIIPDPKFKDKLVAKFTNSIMLSGKKATAEGILYGAFDVIKDRFKEEPIDVFRKALDNVKPKLEVKSRRVGGATYQVPVEVRPERRVALAMRWLVTYSRQRGEKTMMERLAAELVDAAQNRGNAVKKKEDTHKMAEANKAFAHYRW